MDKPTEKRPQSQDGSWRYEMCDPLDPRVRKQITAAAIRSLGTQLSLGQWLAEHLRVFQLMFIAWCSPYQEFLRKAGPETLLAWRISGAKRLRSAGLSRIFPLWAWEASQTRHDQIRNSKPKRMVCRSSHCLEDDLYFRYCLYSGLSSPICRVIRFPKFSIFLLRLVGHWRHLTFPNSMVPPGLPVCCVHGNNIAGFWFDEVLWQEGV